MTVYLRREPRDGHWQHGWDVAAYYDPQCTEPAHRWSEHKPRVNCRRVRFEGYCWRAVWLEDL